MARWRNCGCARCRMHGLMGPAILITIGLLFFLDQSGNWHYDFGRTWPVILIVIGVIKLLSDTVSSQGHIQPGSPWQNPPVAPPPGSQTPPPPPPAAPPAL